MNRPPSVQVTVVKGEVSASALKHAREKVGGILRLASAPVLSARVTLAREVAPDIQRPAVAKATLDVNGKPVRARAAATTLAEAIDLLEAKLRHGLEIMAQHRQSRRHEPAQATAGSWRHGMLPTARPVWLQRPIEERQLVEHEPYLPDGPTLAEAVDDLQLLDQDWLLFTEQTTGADALLEHTDDGYRLTLAAVAASPSADLDGRVEVQVGVPRMDLPTALDLLAELGTPLVFFVDSDTGRGRVRVVYRRYDGHYGTLTCANGPVQTRPVRDRSRP